MWLRWLTTKSQVVIHDFPNRPQVLRPSRRNTKSSAQMTEDVVSTGRPCERRSIGPVSFRGQNHHQHLREILSENSMRMVCLSDPDSPDAKRKAPERLRLIPLDSSCASFAQRHNCRNAVEFSRMTCTEEGCPDNCSGIALRYPRYRASPPPECTMLDLRDQEWSRVDSGRSLKPNPATQPFSPPSLPPKRR